MPPLESSAQFFTNALSNFRSLIAGRLNMLEGMKELFERFYISVLNDRPVPIPYREILLTSQVMDAVFAQLADDRPDVLAVPPSLRTA
ncbi:MAG TPA: hypothetical protein VLE20_08570, partial [Blastocatellia bacterium]|nr:hypothetical protein [Blastocatellia bacterium]